MLLDRAELGRGLRPDDREQLLRGLRIEVLGDDRLGLTGAVAHLDAVRHVLLDAGAEAERLVLGEIGVPLFGELRVVREVVALPVHDRLVVLARKLALLVGHGTPPRSVLTK